MREQSLGVTHFTSSFVVVEVHQRYRVLWLLSALSSVLSVHESSGEGDAEVHVIRAAGPLQTEM